MGIKEIKIKSSQYKWALRFLKMAQLVSTWSKDPSTKCGAVIARPDRTIVSVGFNGFPQAMKDRPEWYADRQEKYSRIIHGEINALIHAKEPVRGFILYNYPFAPCDRCVVQLIQAGIYRFIFPEATADAVSRWGDSFKKTKQYMIECGAKYAEIPLCELSPIQS